MNKFDWDDWVGSDANFDYASNEPEPLSKAWWIVVAAAALWVALVLR